MIARFPGTCACGCGERFAAGAELVRAPAGWARAGCVAPAVARPPPGSAAEVAEVLVRARTGRKREERARGPQGGVF